VPASTRWQRHLVTAPDEAAEKRERSCLLEKDGWGCRCRLSPVESRDPKRTEVWHDTRRRMDGAPTSAAGSREVGEPWKNDGIRRREHGGQEKKNGWHPDWECEHLAQTLLTTTPGLDARINWGPDWPSVRADVLQSIPETNFWHSWRCAYGQSAGLSGSIKPNPLGLGLQIGLDLLLRGQVSLSV